MLGSTNNTIPALRTLNVRSVVPVDLNSVLCRPHYLTRNRFTSRHKVALDKYRMLLADLYELRNRSEELKPISHNVVRTTHHTDQQRAEYHRSVAGISKSAVLDLFWDPNRVAFYDFNLTSNARGTIFTPATFWPYWDGIIPNEVLSSEEVAKQVFSSVRLVMARYNGTLPASFLVSGLQWDAPKSVILIQPLE